MLFNKKNNFGLCDGQPTHWRTGQEARGRQPPYIVGKTRLVGQYSLQFRLLKVCMRKINWRNFLNVQHCLFLDLVREV